MSHRTVLNVCRSLRNNCEFYPERKIALALEPYSGLGLALWCLASVFTAHHTFLFPLHELEANPAVWLSILSQHRGTHCLNESHTALVLAAY